MYLINIYKDFKIWTQQNPEGTIFTNDNGGYSYTDGEKTLEFDKKEKLCSFLFRVKASYKDDDGNIRSMILGYDASCAALYEGRTLLDKYGNQYALDSTGRVCINGNTLVAQLPFGAYIIDWERNAEIEAERLRKQEAKRQLEEARRQEEELKRYHEEWDREQAKVKARKKRSKFLKVAACVGGVVVVIVGGVLLSKK